MGSKENMLRSEAKVNRRGKRLRQCIACHRRGYVDVRQRKCPWCHARGLRGKILLIEVEKPKHQLHLFTVDYNGWLSPSGILTKCRDCEHVAFAEDIAGAEVFDASKRLEKKGWAKLGRGKWYWDYRNPRLPTPAQRRFMVAWCTDRGEPVSVLIQDED